MHHAVSAAENTSSFLELPVVNLESSATEMDRRFLLDESSAMLEPKTHTSSQLLRDSLRVYGTTFLIGFVIYCYVRKKFPRIFAVRQWVPDIKSPLADEQFGYISWLWKVYSFRSDQLLESIGLDALCFVRIMNMGFRLACVGCFNSMWLFPVYGTAVRGPYEGDREDGKVGDLSINGLKDNDPRFLATVVAAYIFFGYTMHTILIEFRWFVQQRHNWLRRFNARNYTILVRNIPAEMRSNTLLMEHFQLLYPPQAVLEAHLCLHVADLEVLVANRNVCIANLEHALAEFHLHGKRPRHLAILHALQTSMETQTMIKVEVDSIDHYTQELHELNSKIASRIDQTTVPGTREIISPTGNTSDEVIESNNAHAEVFGSNTTTDTHYFNAVSEIYESSKEIVSPVTEGDLTSFTVKRELGLADDAGFVVFTKLAAVHSALQMSQHSEPFVLKTEPAPDEPEYIFWRNVGKDKEAMHLGYLASVLGTVSLCLSWTFIVTFIVNLSNVEYLSENIDSLDQILERHPWLVNVLAMISPLLLMIFNSGLLPLILRVISMLEFPASNSLLQASMFWKMATFSIIQTFFVSLITGSVIQSLAYFIENPTELVKLFGNSLPHQSVYFMQLLIVSTTIGSLMELFRVTPILFAIGRSFIGKRLTEKERRQQAGIFYPLCIVKRIAFHHIQSQYLLFFMVLFVYSPISPLINWVCLIFFLLIGSVYRHQFIFNYPPTPDSGGLMYLQFIRVVLTCMMLAQFTLVGFLFLKKSVVGTPFMIPLLIITSLFLLYIHQHHFSIGKNLPARDCNSQDLSNANADFSSFKDEFKNPALKVSFLDADWDSGKDGQENVGEPGEQPHVTDKSAPQLSNMSASGATRTQK